MLLKATKFKNNELRLVIRCGVYLFELLPLDGLYRTQVEVLESMDISDDYRIEDAINRFSEIEKILIG